MTVDFYDLLGIDRDASQEEVRRAFRDQVREYHPDRNDDPRAPAQFTAIKKAYETLGDSKEREDYDRMGHNTYCAKRINGLPSAEEWQLPDRDETGGSTPTPGGDAPSDSPGGSKRGKTTASKERRATGTGDEGTTADGSRGADRSPGSDDGASNSDEDAESSATWSEDAESNATWSEDGSSDAAESSTAGGRERPSAPRGRSTARTSATGAGTARSGPTAAQARRRSGSTTGSPTGSNGQTNATGSKASAAAAGGGGGSNGTPAGSGESVLGNADPLGTVRAAVDRVRRTSIGWSFILVSDVMYLVGLAMYFRQNYSELELLAAELAAAATGTGSIGGVLGSSPEIVSLSRYIQSSVWSGSAAGGILLILGVASLPSVYFFIIRETRKIETPWRPSYLYVLGALGPAIGLVVNGVATPPGLYLEVLCYVLLPALGILGLPFSAFVLPRIRRAIRKTRHRLVG